MVLVELIQACQGYCGQCQHFKTSRSLPKVVSSSSSRSCKADLGALWSTGPTEAEFNFEEKQYFPCCCGQLPWSLMCSLDVGVILFPWTNGWTDTLLGYYELNSSGWDVHYLLFNTSQIQYDRGNREKNLHQFLKFHTIYIFYKYPLLRYC